MKCVVATLVVANEFIVLEENDVTLTCFEVITSGGRDVVSCTVLSDKFALVVEEFSVQIRSEEEDGEILV